MCYINYLFTYLLSNNTKTDYDLERHMLLTYSPGGHKVIAVYDAASNCLTSAYKQKKLSLLYPYNGKRSDAKHFFH